MRLPNGYGSVTKQSGKRRKPYVVRKTVGWRYDEKKDKYVQDMIVIGYAKTKNEGLQMLANYNKQPYDVALAKQTFADVYEAWSKQKYNSIAPSTAKLYRAAYSSMSFLYEKTFRDIKLSDIQHALASSGQNYPMLKNMRTLLRQVYSYAVKYEICEKDYAAYIDLSEFKDKNPNKRSHDRFTDSEIRTFWGNSSDPYVQIILMLIYTGVRISELLLLEKRNISLDEQIFFVGKSKTPSGIRRVPIADLLIPFFDDWMASSPKCPYLLHAQGEIPLKYSNYRATYFEPLMKQLGIPDDRTPHWARHTCASMMADAHVEPSLQKMILGHSGAMSVTERVYTHVDNRTLIDAVNKICVRPV